MSQETYKIFLVDDDDFLLEMLEDHIQGNCEYPVKTETFTSGEACISHLHLNPTIVVLDYHFMDTIRKGEAMAGGDILKQIKAKNENIAVIMISADKDIEKIEESLEYKAHAYVPKGDEAFDQVLTNIHSILKRKHKEQKQHKMKLLLTIGGVIVVVVILLILLYFFAF